MLRASPRGLCGLHHLVAEPIPSQNHSSGSSAQVHGEPLVQESAMILMRSPMSVSAVTLQIAEMLDKHCSFVLYLKSQRNNLFVESWRRSCRQTIPSIPLLDAGNPELEHLSAWWLPARMNSPNPLATESTELGLSLSSNCSDKICPSLWFFLMWQLYRYLYTCAQQYQESINSRNNFYGYPCIVGHSCIPVGWWRWIPGRISELYCLHLFSKMCFFKRIFIFIWSLGEYRRLHPVPGLLISFFICSDHIKGPSEAWQHLGVPSVRSRLHPLFLCVSNCQNWRRLCS